MASWWSLQPCINDAVFGFSRSPPGSGNNGTKAKKSARQEPFYTHILPPFQSSISSPFKGTGKCKFFPWRTNILSKMQASTCRLNQTLFLPGQIFYISIYWPALRGAVRGLSPSPGGQGDGRMRKSYLPENKKILFYINVLCVNERCASQSPRNPDTAARKDDRRGRFIFHWQERDSRRNKDEPGWLA